MGTQDGHQFVPRGVKKGMGLIIVLVWTGWAVAVLVAPILKHAELADEMPSTLLSRGGGLVASVPVHLPHRRKAGAGPTKMDKIVRQLADMYSTHCTCHEELECPCAQNATRAVSAALDNAVDREFAPPNMYYRSKNGYSFRLRGFQQAKTHMNGGLHHDKFLDLKPISTNWRVPRPAAASAPRITAKPAEGLPPIKVQDRFVTAPSVGTYTKSHFVRKVTDDPVVIYPASKARAPTKLQQQRTTQLWEFNYVPLADEEFPGKHPTVMEQQALKEAFLEHLKAECKENVERCMEACRMSPETCKEFADEEAEEEDEKVGNLDDELDQLDSLLKPLGVDGYTDMILNDGELEEAKAASGLPPANDAAFAIPYQEGEEADWADWLYAFDDDAVRPLRLVEGESNFPEMDANINAPGAVLEDYPGQSGGGESFASFLKHPAGEGGEMVADATSVNGWLTDNSAY